VQVYESVLLSEINLESLCSSLDYLLVFVSHTNVLLVRDGEGPCLTRVIVALTPRAHVACIQARGKGKGKGKEYIVRKYLDGCVNSSNYCDFFFFLFFFYII